MQSIGLGLMIHTIQCFLNKTDIRGAHQFANILHLPALALAIFQSPGFGDSVF